MVDGNVIFTLLLSISKKSVEFFNRSFSPLNIRFPIGQIWFSGGLGSAQLLVLGGYSLS